MPGYSNKPLWVKLGIKENSQVVIKNTTKLNRPIYEDEVNLVYPVANEYHSNMDIIHLFVDQRRTMETELNCILTTREKENISIWISWPKKASRIETNITEDIIRDVIIPLGLVDVKVCSVSDELWSGLKIVIRLEHRK